jgi:hypothetical protein
MQRLIPIFKCSEPLPKLGNSVRLRLRTLLLESFIPMEPGIFKASESLSKLGISVRLRLRTLLLESSISNEPGIFKSFGIFIRAWNLCKIETSTSPPGVLHTHATRRIRITVSGCVRVCVCVWVWVCVCVGEGGGGG